MFVAVTCIRFHLVQNFSKSVDVARREKGKLVQKNLSTTSSAIHRYKINTEFFTCVTKFHRQTQVAIVC